MVSEVSKDTVSASSEAVERLSEMAEWLKRGDPGAEGSVLLAASVAAEHAADLRALISTLRSQAEALEKRDEIIGRLVEWIEDEVWAELPLDSVSNLALARKIYLAYRAALTPEVKP